MPAIVELPDQHQRGLHDIERLEARDHHRPLELLGEKLVRWLPITALTCDGPRNASTRYAADRADLRAFQNVLDRGGSQNVIAKQGKFESPSALALRIATALGGVVVSKPMAKNTTSRPGFCRAILSASSMRIDHPHIGALGFRLEQAAALGSGHAQHIAIAAQDHVMLFRQLQRVVDPANRQHADRAAGAMHEIHVLRHQLLHAVAEDRMRVAAAKLHDVVVPGRVRVALDRGRKPFRQSAVAELVDIFHRAASPPNASSSLPSPASRIMASVRSASSADTLWSAYPTWRSTNSPGTTLSSRAIETSFLIGPRQR